MAVRCRECGCCDTRVQEVTRHPFVWMGRNYIYVERVVKCRYCGLDFRDVVKEEGESSLDDIDPGAS